VSLISVDLPLHLRPKKKNEYMSLFYLKLPKLDLTGYANAGYLSDSHNGKLELTDYADAGY
jgi:hypothetical protein